MSQQNILQPEKKSFNRSRRLDLRMSFAANLTRLMTVFLHLTGNTGYRAGHIDTSTIRHHKANLSWRS